MTLKFSHLLGRLAGDDGSQLLVVADKNHLLYAENQRDEALGLERLHQV